MWSGLKGLMIDIKSLKKTKSFLGLLFVSPLVLGILIFIAGPVIFSFVLSFFLLGCFITNEICRIRQLSVVFRR